MVCQPSWFAHQKPAFLANEESRLGRWPALLYYENSCGIGVPFRTIMIGRPVAV